MSIFILNKKVLHDFFKKIANFIATKISHRSAVPEAVLTLQHAAAIPYVHFQLNNNSM